MRKKGLLCYCAALLLGGLILAFAAAHALDASTIERITDVADLSKSDISLPAVWGMEHSEEVYNALLCDAADQIHDVIATDTMAVIRPTGELAQHSDILSQQAVVVETFAPDMLTAGEYITIYRTGGFREADGKLCYDETMNVLYPENTYLVFLIPLQTNEYTEGKDFRLPDSYGAINLMHGTSSVCKSQNLYDARTLNHFCATEDIRQLIETIESTIVAQCALDSDAIKNAARKFSPVDLGALESMSSKPFFYGAKHELDQETLEVYQTLFNQDVGYNFFLPSEFTREDLTRYVRGLNIFPDVMAVKVSSEMEQCIRDYYKQSGMLEIPNGAVRKISRADAMRFIAEKVGLSPDDIPDSVFTDLYYDKGTDAYFDVELKNDYHIVPCTVLSGYETEHGEIVLQYTFTSILGTAYQQNFEIVLQKNQSGEVCCVSNSCQR